MKTKFLILAGFVTVLLAGRATLQQASLQRNKAIVRRYFEEWGNHGDTKAPDKLIATDDTLRNPPAVVHSLVDCKRGLAVFHTAFPDLHFKVEKVVAEYDKVVVRWSLSGTQLVDYQG